MISEKGMIEMIRECKTKEQLITLWKRLGGESFQKRNLHLMFTMFAKKEGNL